MLGDAVGRGDWRGLGGCCSTHLANAPVCENQSVPRLELEEGSLCKVLVSSPCPLTAFPLLPFSGADEAGLRVEESAEQEGVLAYLFGEGDSATSPEEEGARKSLA